MTAVAKATKRKTGRKAKPEQLVNNELRIFTDFPVGSVSHQGDLILVSVPRPHTLTPRTNRQLADGDTQGSRHILDGGQLFDGDAEDLARLVNQHCHGAAVQARYVGPVFTTPATLTHPEHGHQRFDCEATVAVVYQRNLDSEEREQRVID